MVRFGGKLKALRLHHKMTLKALATELGYTTHAYISEIESNKKVPTTEFVLKVGRLFGVTTDELLNDRIEINPQNLHFVKGDLMFQIFVKRSPTLNEIEKFRLIMSTYQDGTGMRKTKDNRTLPGWRDFERATALAFGGLAPEKKGILDVLFKDNAKEGYYYGVDCKMRGEGGEVNNKDRVVLELSNASSKFRAELGRYGITPENYRENPHKAGCAIIELVKKWHDDVGTRGIELDGKLENVDLKKCYYLALSWNKSGEHQLYQFPFQLPDPKRLKWYCPVETMKGKKLGHIKADDGVGTLFEWYGTSGGQLKYYPKVETAVWKSAPFKLEPLPERVTDNIIAKVAHYFPELWKIAIQEA